MRTASRPLSIAAKLPLTLAALLSVVLFVMALAGYVEVRNSSMMRAADQLDHASRQVVGLLGQTQRPRLAALQATAGDANATDFLLDPTPLARAAVVDRIEQAAKAAVPGTTFELWDADRRPVLTVGPSLPPMSQGDAADLAQRARDAKGPVTGSFTRMNDGVAQAVAIPILRDQVVVGYLVDRKPLVNSPQSMALLMGLVGANARLLIGNDDFGVWTDFMKPVSAPPPSIGASSLASYTRDDGEPVFGHAIRLPGTPLLVASEIPQAPVLAPVRRFVIRALALWIGLALAGAGLGWFLSQRVTDPLRRMTAVAEAVAAGQSTARIGLQRDDELGRLARAFDTMVDEVESARGRLERRVAERTVELETANRELEAFSYSISHDLRAPLRAIAGFSSIIVEDHAAELSPEARGHLERITRNTRSMGQLIDDLLAFAKVGRQPMERLPTDMTALVRSAVEEAKRTEPERAIEFVVEPLPEALVHRSLMKQVIDNLLLNAVKFTRARNPARIEIGFREHAGRPAFFVRDNGAGFDMQYRDKLFGVFQRLHGADEFEGTGVGLAIVRRIVARHGGETWAEGVIDGGATFFFTLGTDV